MRIKRKLAFRLIALLMLTAIAIMPMVPAGASPGLEFPGKYTFHSQDGSYRNMTLCTSPTDTDIVATQGLYGCKQGFDIIFSDPWGPGSNLVNITVPQESFSSEELYVKPIMPGAVWLWVKLHAVGDAFGTLALAPGVLDVSPISINVTGNGAANTTNDFTVDVIVGDTVPDPAGSCKIFMPLNLSVWFSMHQEYNDRFIYLYDMNFSSVLTTGKINVTVIDDTPYPPDMFPHNLTRSLDGLTLEATGVPFNLTTGVGTLVSAGAGLDIYYYLSIPAFNIYMDLWTDFAYIDVDSVAALPPPPVGGIWIPVDKLALLAPYIALASTVILAVAATAIFFKYRKKP